ncbi:MAG: hypothetical protein PHF84_09590 [bacterium]|nr:hypothetical protein [bacterium]
MKFDLKKHSVPVIIFLALFLLFITTVFISMNAMNGYRSLREKFISDKAVLQKFTAFKEDGKGFEQLMTRLNKQPLKSSESISIFEMFNREAGKSGVAIISFSPESPATGCLNTRLLVRGNYINILKFFELIEKSVYFLQITGFEIYSVDSQKQVNEAKLSIRIYTEK